MRYIMKQELFSWGDDFFIKDETGTDVHSEKVVEIHFAGDKPVRNGDQFGIGRVK